MQESIIKKKISFTLRLQLYSTIAGRGENGRLFSRLRRVNNPTTKFKTVGSSLTKIEPWFNCVQKKNAFPQTY